MARVLAEDVCFHYPVYELGGRSLKMAVIRQVAGAKLVVDGGHTVVQALEDVSFELGEGDRLGLIGHNGAGKSTLLRVIAGLAHPQRGRLKVSGRLIALIDKGMGINADLTGMENIELPLRLLGASTDEVRRAQRDIPEWTGLGPFLNLPFRTYSDGMKARLSFALCTAIAGDVLVLDEWLGAGDAAFVEQAQIRLNEFIARSKILVLASHSLSLISNVCNLAAWFERGRLVLIGPAPDVITAYAAHASRAPLAT